MQKNRRKAAVPVHCSDRQPLLLISETAPSVGAEHEEKEEQKQKTKGGILS